MRQLDTIKRVKLLDLVGREQRVESVIGIGGARP